MNHFGAYSYGRGGNADMHLKNWTLLYPDGRTPQLAPAYDFVSTIAYIDDRKLGLSIARKVKDVGKFDESLLHRFADRAGLPRNLVSVPALETSASIVRVWPEMRGDLVMDERARKLIDERLRYFPLTRQFIKES